MIFLIFIFILGGVSALGYASTRDLQNNFLEIQNYAVPSLTISNKLQNRTQQAILAAYDYLISGEKTAKDSYNNNLAEAFNFQVELFEVTKDQADIKFIEQLNKDLFEIKTFLTELLKSTKQTQLHLKNLR